MANITVEVTTEALHGILQGHISEAIRKAIENNSVDIKKSIEEYFSKGMFQNKKSQFDSALDWAVEQAFREGLNTAMEELNFHEVIAAKAKEILSDNNFIAELAEEKIRQSLGLLPFNADPLTNP